LEKKSISISAILEQGLTHEEKVMLGHFSKISSLVLETEAVALFRLCMLLPHNRRILEIGSYRGGSTVAMGHASRLRSHEIYCIDRWSDYIQQSDFINMDQAQLNDMNILSDFIENTAFIKDRLYMLRGNAAIFSKILGHNLFSLVFIDGAHDYFSVIDDIICGLGVVEPGGMLCGHDYHSAGIDVKRAVHDIVMQSETIVYKGLIENTSIWYAIIEDPEYELLLAKTIKQMALGDFKEAYRIIVDGRAKVKNTKEIDRILNGLALKLEQ